jgi:Nitrate and nitrite sensing
VSGERSHRRLPHRGTIGRRLGRILALPAAVVLALLGVVAAGQVEDYRASAATSQSVVLALATQNLVHELQIERGVTAGLLGGNESFKEEVALARQRVDKQRQLVAGLVAGGGEIEDRVANALHQLDGLPTVRSATDANSAGRVSAFDYYTQQITAVNAVDFGLDRSTDQDLRQGVASLQALADLSEATSQERALLNGVFSAGGFAKDEFVQFAGMRAAKQLALQRFARSSTPEAKAGNAYLQDTGAAQVAAYFETVAVGAADGHHIVVNPQEWWSSMTTVLDDMRQLQQHVGSTIQVRAHELQRVASLRLAALLGVVLACLAASAYLAVLASRSITRPLAALAAEANNVAVDRLPAAVHRVQVGTLDDTPQPPEPVRVPDRATAEIQSVAQAVDRLQGAAYLLATDQAMLRRGTVEALANLGRRNQNLIRRQLGFITTLEQREVDPSSLANLFELDHLATRMRRYAASLLVLVGASAPRRWSAPVPVADVIRAAVSEVEEYRRISLRRLDVAQVSGTAAGSVAHLLSELIENGLLFSPPDSEVEIQGRSIGDSYLIAVVDQGVGMSADELRLANSRLSGEGDFIATPTRFLGHFVVGQLAHENGVHVELLPSAVVGITARVTLPASLLVTQPAVESGPAGPSAARHSITLPHDLTTDELAVGDVSSGGISVPSGPRRLSVPNLSLVDEPTWAQDDEADGVVATVTAVTDLTDDSALRLDAATELPQPSEPVYASSSAINAATSGALDAASREGSIFTVGASSPQDAVAHTRNGLVKRVPRAARPGAPAEAPPVAGNPYARSAPVPTVGYPSLLNDSPAEVRNRLMAFRDGVRRAQGDGDSASGDGASDGSDQVSGTQEWA